MLKRIFFKEHYSSIATEEQLLFSFFYLILFFNFTVLYWFCHISTWIRHRHTRNMYNIIYETSRQSRFDARYLDAWGWCTGMTQKDGTGREEGGGFRTGNTCIPVADSCWYMAKPTFILNCSVFKLYSKQICTLLLSSICMSKPTMLTHIYLDWWFPTFL